MPYIAIDDFRTGLDRRRPAIAGAAGSLYELTNGHLTRGGDIERRKAFVNQADLSGTFGLASVGGKLWVFNSTSRPATLPNNIAFAQLQHPLRPATAMTAVVDVTGFDGKTYTVAEFADGTVHHFYGRKYVSDWEAIASNTTQPDMTALYLRAKIDANSRYDATRAGTTVTITASEPGTAFTYEAAATSNNSDTSVAMTETVANVEEVKGDPSLGSFQVSGGEDNVGEIRSVTVNGVELLPKTIKYTIDDPTTVDLIAAEINSQETTPNYTATASYRTLKIEAEVQAGTTPNGYAIEVVTAQIDQVDDGSGGTTEQVTLYTTTSSTDTTNNSNFTDQFKIENVQDMADGAAYVAPVAQVVEIDLAAMPSLPDRMAITLDGVDYFVEGGTPTVGRQVLAFSQKIYTHAGGLVRFSALNDPMKWRDDGEEPPGAGFFGITTESAGITDIVGIGVYNGNLAVFSRNVVHVWFVDVDPGRNQLLHTVENTGTRAAGAIQSYGNNDVFYLSDTGIRSLRARDSSGAPTTSDVGTPIDPLIRTQLTTLTQAQIEGAAAVMDVVDSRYWLSLGGIIFVFTYFEASKVSGWSIYDAGFTPTKFVRIADRIYARGDDDALYLYGGQDGDTYPSAAEAPLLVRLPYMTAGKPATRKILTGLDVAAEGRWRARVLLDPTDITIGTDWIYFVGQTYTDYRVAMMGETTHMGVQLECDDDGYALLVNLGVHFEEVEGG